MPDQSIRGFLASLQQSDEIVRFTKEVDPDSNLSALSWQTYARLGKGCMFENLKGHPGWRVVSQIVADRRKWGVALGVPEAEVVQTLDERISRPIAPVLVDRADAPVKAVVHLGGDVDLRRIPAMWTSEADPGRYIASGMCIIKDPKTGIRNMSVHRAQVIGADRTGYLICPRQALKIYQMYGELKRPMEAAMVIGGHPAIIFSAGYVAPYGVDELSLAGGLLGEPIRLVKCETLDIEVPADAEIVLEGELHPGEMTEEGPFGEVTGGYAQEGSTPLFRIKAITHRKDPIFYAMQCGLPPSDTHSIVCTTLEMRLWQYIKSVAGGIDLIDLRCIATVTPMMVLLKLRPRFPGQARAAMLAALSSPYLHPKIAVAVDEDIDLGDLRQVYWAIANRVTQGDDLQKIDRARVFSLDNASPIEEGMSAMYRVGTKMLIDATRALSATPLPAAAPAAVPAKGRERLAAAFGLGAETLALDLASRLSSSAAPPAAIAPAKRAVAPRDSLSALAGDGTAFEAILAIAGDRPNAPLLGLAKFVRLAWDRLVVTRPTWRLAAALRKTMGEEPRRRPAVLILGASAACRLGAALDGWRGRGGWDLARALGEPPSEFERTSNGIEAPAGFGLEAEGTVAVDSAEGWSFVIERVSAGKGSAADDAAMEAVEALACEIAIAHHVVQIEGGLDVLDVRCFPETGNRLVVLKIRPKVEGQSKTACMGVLSSPDIGPRLVIAVDEDIDAGDLRDVAWSFASRVHAGVDIAALAGLPAQDGSAGEFAPVLKWFVDSTKPPLTQPAKRAEFTRATPKNLGRVRLEEFLPD